MIVRNGIALIALAGLGAVLSGCAATGKRNFSCSGPPGGVTCIGSLDIYEITNDPALEAELRARLVAAAESGRKVDPNVVLAELRAKRKATNAVGAPLAEPLKQPLPVLEPARVVRIWIAPWVDNKGDLRMPGYVFSEITPRRWSFGEAQIEQTDVLVPVQIEARATRDASGAKQAAGSKAVDAAVLKTASGAAPPTVRPQ
jgi:conjugal transfer pilus assembly protein TraV